MKESLDNGSEWGRLRIASPLSNEGGTVPT